MAKYVPQSAKDEQEPNWWVVSGFNLTLTIEPGNTVPGNTVVQCSLIEPTGRRSQPVWPVRAIFRHLGDFLKRVKILIFIVITTLASKEN